MTSLRELLGRSVTLEDAVEALIPHAERMLGPVRKLHPAMPRDALLGGLDFDIDFQRQVLPVAWLENRVDRFFLEIQGSGRIVTPENEIVRIQYAGTNGNPYRSIGRYLIDHQEIDREQMASFAGNMLALSPPGRRQLLAMSARARASLRPEQLEALAKARSMAIKDYLVEQHGVKDDRILLCHPEVDKAAEAKPRAEILF